MTLNGSESEVYRHQKKKFSRKSLSVPPARKEGGNRQAARLDRKQKKHTEYVLPEEVDLHPCSLPMGSEEDKSVGGSRCTYEAPSIDGEDTITDGECKKNIIFFV